MEVPDDIKENVRAVLLSKTDGSGILVSDFLKDYKSYIHKPLHFKDLGYQNFEAFLKAIPDVCRLDYSEKLMAYKLFGISKPNTFVSSFVKKAETGRGNEGRNNNRDNSYRRNSQRDNTKQEDRAKKQHQTTNIEDKWLPNSRGLYSVCFKTKKQGPMTQEEIAMKFAQAGEVVEINMIPSLNFIRYRSETAAKRAFILWGEELGVRRADEQQENKKGRGKGDRRDGDKKEGDRRCGDRKGVRRGGDHFGNKSGNNMGKSSPNNPQMNGDIGTTKRASNQQESSEDEWDLGGGGEDAVGKVNVTIELGNDINAKQEHGSGGTAKKEPREYDSLVLNSKNSDRISDMGSETSDKDRRHDEQADRQFKNMNKGRGGKSGGRGRSGGQSEGGRGGGQSDSGGVGGHGRNKTGSDFSKSRDGSNSVFSDGDDRKPSGRGRGNQTVQVYVGNWPHEGTKAELESLIKGYSHCGCKIMNQEKEGKTVKSYAFVDFLSLEEATRMVQELNEHIYRRRNLQVRMGRKNQGAQDLENAQPPDVVASMKELTMYGRLSDSPPPLEKLASPPPLEQNSRNLYADMPEIVPAGPPSLERHSNQPMERAGPPSLERNSAKHGRKDNQYNDMPPIEPIGQSYLERQSHPGKYPANQGKYEQNDGQYQQNHGKYGGNQGNLGQCDGKYGQNQGTQWQRDGQYPGNHGDYAENMYVDMPPLQSDRPPRGGYGENKGSKSSDQQVERSSGEVQLMVSNFPYGTSPDDLYVLFAPYGGKDMKMMNQSTLKRSTYAYVTVTNISRAQEAVRDLDQYFFRGRRLIVTCADQSVMFPDDISVPNPSNNMARSDANGPQLSPGSVMSSVSQPGVSQVSHNGALRTSRNRTGKVRNDYVFMRLTVMLKEYGHISIKLRNEDYTDYQPGVVLKVLVTHVENERFFWGQIVHDSVKGQNGSLEIMHQMTIALQGSEFKEGPFKSRGRCAAKFDGDWYRGWCVCETVKNGEDVGDVLFIDYGNRCLVPKSDMYMTKKNLWKLPPMGKPFKLLEFEQSMQGFVDKLVMLEIVEVGLPDYNYVTSVKILDAE